MIIDAAGTRRRMWIARALTLLAGVVLGCIEIALLFSLIVPPDLSLAAVVLLSAGCYFFFALVAGMLTALRGDDSVSGAGKGCLVGGIGVLTLTIPAAVFAIIQFTTPHADCVRPACPYIFNPTALAHSVALLALLVALAEGFCALVASSLGGWLGSWLGERMAS